MARIVSDSHPLPKAGEGRRERKKEEGRRTATDNGFFTTKTQRTHQQ
jgi:hypothetical protein